MNKIITVSREFGSGGRTIAKMAAEKLQIPVYDSELLAQIAQKSGLDRGYIDQKAEHLTLSNILSSSLSKIGNYSQPTAEVYLWNMQKQVILELAQKESCSIVGRCSDFILEEMKNSMHIYIYAPYDVRVQQSVENLKLELSEARQMIVDVDEARDSYHMHYAGYLPDDKNHKDILIDSSFLGVEKTAQYLAEAVRQKFGA